MENPIENRAVKIETITTPEGNQVSFCPERGGIITSIKFKGKEILYLDEATLQNPKVNVKGGIPILFPNAGPLEGPQYPNLKQHGFARDSSRWKTKKSKKGFRETLTSSEETKKMFPVDFRLSIDANFRENGSFSVDQEVENLEDNEELPLSMGLHPYFKVPQDKKSEIKFNFDGGKFIEEQIEVWANGKAISIDNPKVKDSNAVMEVVIPGLGTLVIDASPEFRKIWIWSMPGKDFVCVEPVMRNKGGLVVDPEKVKPGETFHSRVNFRLKEWKNPLFD
ncbi:hypothetical protein A2917_00670 [Candidatus Nomurabacteria bacterium RIFCSPLOWO2_01_FULL_42_17]|uniref:Aldose epimerase n=1 Tax=Candidatus Nomurabacteria bacterium RIFCSPLOWO2_01_FULL_42_17 TaxID=1801780 RepID=A0A1F6XM00_9BACT|nr:MAG: hypothetical protein A2917_00670 [Candidatus Nomurabacteria bacterium RIFCSPLOWO2_01_FULL_42_17]